MIDLSEETKNKLKKILFENVVSIIVLVAGLVYFFFQGELVGIAFILVFLPWFIFSTIFFGALFDRNIFFSRKNLILASCTIGSLGSTLFFYIGLEDVVYLFMLFAFPVGLIIALILIFTSRLKKY